MRQGPGNHAAVARALMSGEVGTLRIGPARARVRAARQSRGLSVSVQRPGQAEVTGTTSSLSPAVVAVGGGALGGSVLGSLMAMQAILTMTVIDSAETWAELGADALAQLSMSTAEAKTEVEEEEEPPPPDSEDGGMEGEVD